MPKQSLSLKTYLAFARSRPRSADRAARAPRPDGALVWAHADTSERSRALGSICARIMQQRQGVGTLMTGVATGAALQDALPPDSLLDAQDFLDHWSPTLCLWSGQTLHPALLNSAANARCRLALVGASSTTWTVPAPRWIPDPTPGALQQFDVIFTEDIAAERRLRRMGVADSALRRSGPLTEATLPLECPRLQHQEMSELLAGRPVWAAARVRASEVGLILRAHRTASRLSHRLLLILAPNDPDEFEAIASDAAQSGFRLCHWDDGEMPDENTQILLASGPDELGLWYRLSPLSFIGGSLVAGHGGHDPLEAAALGSAVLYGPNVGQHLTAYTRLVDAGAARIVRDADSLSTAVSHLIAPDHAAAMAHAGWDVVSAGAEMTDKVVDQALDWLDQAERV